MLFELFVREAISDPYRSAINDQYLTINDVDKSTQLVAINPPNRQKNQLGIHLTTCRFVSVWLASILTHVNSTQEDSEIRNVVS